MICRYVRTKILSPEVFNAIENTGVAFATAADAGACALRILSDSSVNGHSFFVCLPLPFSSSSFSFFLLVPSSFLLPLVAILSPHHHY